jgi:hypothetical protein
MTERKLWWTVRLGALALRALALTWRWEFVNFAARSALRDRGQNFIFAMWHTYIVPTSLHIRGEGYTIMISDHGDGELIAKLHELWGNHAVRGSTSRGAGRALLGMVRILQEGQNGLITPDGPRGPAGVAQPGALMASQRAGVPILAVRFEASRAWRLKSWDRFMVPKPFARIRVTYSDPWIAPDSSEASQREFERLLGPALPIEPEPAA